MQAGGHLPVDAPDPRHDIAAQISAMPIPLIGLVAQPHLEDWGARSVESSQRSGELEQLSASISYTFWRVPEDRDDPANLAELDEETRRDLAAEPPWPRPDWLVEQVARLRYPTLWEVVRTTWCSPAAPAGIVHHARNVLLNSQQGRSGPAAGLFDEGDLEDGVPLVVDGSEVAGVRLDTLPEVVAVGAHLGDRGLLTAVIDRDVLPLLTVEFATQPR